MKQLQCEIHELAKEKGWWDTPRSALEVCALVHSEISEAVEEVRAGTPAVYQKRECSTFPQYESWIRNIEPSDVNHPWRPSIKPEGEAVELADAIIRILDYAQYRGWDMEQIIRLKHEYNKTRPYRHGNKKA